jgi:hypothetical protein
MAAALVAPMLRPLRGVGGAGRAAPRKHTRVGIKCNAENDRYGQSEDDVLQVSGDWRQFRCVSPRPTMRKARDAKKRSPSKKRTPPRVMTPHLARKSGSETVTTSVSQKTFFFP